MMGLCVIGESLKSLEYDERITIPFLVYGHVLEMMKQDRRCRIRNVQSDVV
jgi:hypothetical protein